MASSFQRLSVVGFIVICAMASSLHAEPTKPIDTAPNFALQDYRGKPWSLEQDGKDKTVVVAFLGVECPLVRLYAKRLDQIRKDYADKGIVVVGINSNVQDTLTEMGSLVRRQGVDFLYLKDPGNQVADQFGAERTPEVFVLDPSRKVRYRGRIDDQYTYGLQRPEAKTHFLRDALDQLSAGETVKVAATEPVGCHIGRVLTKQADSDVTFSNQIVRIFQKRCVECHRKGDIGPFSLVTYDDSVGWAEMIDEVTHERRMPPWHAEDGHQKYQNNSRLTDDELALIRKWVDAGAPEGDPAELPKLREFNEEWRIGEPDKVVWMSEKPFPVPASGEVRYKYFSVDPKFTKDTWIQAAECRPGNREVVHHIIVGVAGGNPGVHGRKSEWLAATAPGAMPMVLPPGQAKLVPAGSRLVFQMHYTPNGTATEDRSCIGLKIADPADVKHQVATHQAAQPRLRIPPNEENYRAKANYDFRGDAMMLSVFPHMHLRGKSFKYTAYYPNGTTEVLLDVPHYDFNWQNAYIFEKPKRMPKGTRIECIAHYDNSEYNLANPDPEKLVRWGDQTWDEMMIGYFDMYDVPAEPNERTDKILERLKKVDRDTLLDEASGVLKDAEKKFESFGDYLREEIPHIGRVDLITVSNSRMQIKEVSQPARLGETVGGQASLFIRQSYRLPKIIKAKETIAFNDLSRASGDDLSYMRKRFQSSAHFPVTVNGVPGVVNFWCTDTHGFPKEVVELLQAVVNKAK